MENLLAFMIATTGMAHIIVDSFIFEDLRQWMTKKFSFLSKLLTCHQCCGFWCGVFGGLFFDPLFQNNDIMFVFNLFFMGCIGSFSSYIARIVIDYMAFNIEVSLDDLKDDEK